MATVILSKAECEIAEMIGRKRREISLMHGRQTRRDFTPDGIRNEIESSAAELAVAKYLNIYPEWSPTEGEVPRFDLRLRDIRLDVKSTDRPDGNLLIPNLDKSILYFLVCGEMPVKNVIGCLKGELVPERGVWREDMPHLPCWFVPAGKMNRLGERK
jgi:hypothetical protein